MGHEVLVPVRFVGFHKNRRAPGGPSSLRTPHSRPNDPLVSRYFRRP